MPYALILITLLLPGLTFAQEEPAIDKQLERTCNGLERQIKGQLGQLTGRDLIADNNRLAKAQLLLAAHQGLGCSQADIAQSISRNGGLR